MPTIAERAQDFVRDVVTLEVITLTGTINLNATVAAPVATTNLKDLFTKVGQNLKIDNVNISIVAYTRSEWDQDTVSFVATNPPSAVLDAHNATVAAVHKARFEALAVIAKTFTSLLPASPAPAAPAVVAVQAG